MEGESTSSNLSETTTKYWTRNKVKQESFEESTHSWPNVKEEFKEEIKTEDQCYFEAFEDAVLNPSCNQVKFEDFELKDEDIELESKTSEPTHYRLFTQEQIEEELNRSYELPDSDDDDEDIPPASFPVSYNDIYDDKVEARFVDIDDAFTNNAFEGLMEQLGTARDEEMELLRELERLEREAEREIETAEQNLPLVWQEIEDFHTPTDNIPNFKKIDFSVIGNPGFQWSEEVMKPQTPLEWFQLFFTNELFNKITLETNRYVRDKIIGDKVQRPRSIWREFHDITVDEMKAFIGLIINMGMAPLPELKDLWSTNEHRQFHFFAKIFTRDRFFQIYWGLHVAKPEDPNKVGQQVTPILKYINDQSQKHFVPYEHVSIDESSIKFSGRFQYGQYNPNKPTKYAVNCFTMADHVTGYIYNSVIYLGAQTAEGIGRSDLEKSTVHTIVGLCETLKANTNGRGYHIFTGKYYSSPQLSEELLKLEFYHTGTVMLNRIPCKEMREKTKNMKQGEVIAYQLGDEMMVVNWRDKRVITCITTKYTKGSEDVERFLSRNAAIALQGSKDRAIRARGQRGSRGRGRDEAGGTGLQTRARGRPHTLQILDSVSDGDDMEVSPPPPEQARGRAAVRGYRGVAPLPPVGATRRVAIKRNRDVTPPPPVGARGRGNVPPLIDETVGGIAEDEMEIDEVVREIDENVFAIPRVCAGEKETVKIPILISRYTTYMRSVDRADHLYNFERRSLKWWRKVFFWTLEVAITNAFALYKLNLPVSCKRTLTRQKKFRETLINELVGNVRSSNEAANIGRPSKVNRTGVIGNRLDKKFHMQEKMERSKQNDCAVCSDRKTIRKRTEYRCMTCITKPYLCPGTCWNKYHTLVEYKV